jgi:hypothetical protein
LAQLLEQLQQHQPWATQELIDAIRVAPGQRATPM